MASLGEKIATREKELFNEDFCKSSGLSVGSSRCLMRVLYRSSSSKEKSVLLVFVLCADMVPVQCCVSVFGSQCS